MHPFLSSEPNLRISTWVCFNLPRSIVDRNQTHVRSSLSMIIQAQSTLCSAISTRLIVHKYSPKAIMFLRTLNSTLISTSSQISTKCQYFVTTWSQRSCSSTTCYSDHRMTANLGLAKVGKLLAESCRSCTHWSRIQLLIRPLSDDPWFTSSPAVRKL